MRIAMVSEHASPLAPPGGVDAGGQNVHVASLAKALAARGHQVDVYTRRDDARLPERVQLSTGVQVVHVPAGPPVQLPKDELLQWMPAFGDWLAATWAKPAGRLKRPDVVHAHFWMSGVAAQRAAGQIPVVATFHALGSVKRRFQGTDDASPPNRIAIERRLACTVDQVIATCRDEVHELARMGAVPKAVRIVPCGVDLQRFAPVGPSWQPAEARAQAQLAMVTVSRLVERKGVDTVIEALATLPTVRLVVAGGPAAEDLHNDAEANRLRALALRLGVADRVDLIGRVDQAQLPSLLRWADLVVATPWYEPFGIVPLEAMACGRPFVGSAVGGLLDTVRPGVTGVLVPPRDPLALAGAIRELAADPVARDAMGRAARRTALARYGWDQVAEEVEAAYLSLVCVRAGELLTAEAM